MDRRVVISGLAGILIGAGATVCWRMPPRAPGKPDAAAGAHPARPPGRPERGPERGERPPTHATGTARERLLELPVPSQGEIDAFLARRGRSRESLVAAGLLTDNLDLLREAAERFPDDPHVQFLAITNRLFPDQQRAWVERFRASQPDNSLAAYLMAGELFAAGDTAAALEELRVGANLGTFRDFSAESMLGIEAAALDLGGDALGAKLRSTFGLQLPYLRQLRDTIGQLETARQATVSPQEAAELAALGVAIGNDLSQGSASRLLINQLVGMSIETKFLQQLEPDAEYPYFNGTPAELLAEIEADCETIKEGAAVADRALELDEPLLLHYLDRVRISSEWEALEWLRARSGDDRDR